MTRLRLIGFVLILAMLLVPIASAGFFINNDFPFIHYESKPSWGIDISDGTASWEKDGYGILEAPLKIEGFNGKLESRYSSEINGNIKICYAFEEDPKMVDLYVWENVSHSKVVWYQDTIHDEYTCDYDLVIDKGVAKCVTKNNSVAWASDYVSVDGNIVTFERIVSVKGGETVYYYDWVKQRTSKQIKAVKEIGDYWYCSEDVAVVNNKDYAFKAEAWATPKHLQRKIEYSVYVQPSTKDLDEALSDRDYLALDPEWIVGAIRKTYINITNNLGFEANLTYNVTIDLSGFTSDNITIVNASGTDIRPYVNFSLMQGNSTAWLFIDLPKVPTGLSQWYIYEMGSAQTKYNFENFTSAIVSDAGYKPDGSDASSYGWSVERGTTYVYTYAKNHVGINSGGLYINSGATEDRIDRSDTQMNDGNKTMFAWWYMDGAETEEWIGTSGGQYCYCGTIAGKSATNYACNLGGGSTDTGVAFGANGWKALKIDINSDGSGGLFVADNSKLGNCIEADSTLGLQISAGGESQFDDLIISDYYNADQPTYITGPISNYTSNNPPSIDNLRINTTSLGNTNYTNESLNLYFTLSDADDDPITYTVRWYKDGALQSDLNDFNGSIAVSYGNTTKGENWTAYINASDGVNDTLDSRSIFILDAPPNKPTTYAPSTGFLNWTYSSNFSCSGSTDIDGDTPIYEFWINLTDIAIQQNTSMQTYEYVYSLGNGTYKWNCRANDGTLTSSWVGNTTFVWNNSIITGINEKHTDPIPSGGTANYFFNASFNGIRVDRVLATITYDGVTYAGVSQNITSMNRTTFNQTIVVPITNSNQTKSFYWNVTHFDNNGSSGVLKYSYTQNITGLQLTTGCTGSAAVWQVVNFTYADEINNTHIVSDIEGTMTIWLNTSSRDNNISFTFSEDNANSTMLCLSAPADGSGYLTDTQIGYIASGYDRRDYYFINRSLDNGADNVTLYLLQIALANGIDMTVQDQSTNALSDQYIYVQRYDVANDTYKTVTILKTDDDGNAYAYLRKFDTEYLFRIQDYTDIVFLSDNRKITTNSLTFTIPSTTYSDFFDAFSRVSGVITFNNITRIFTASYSGANEVESTCMKVIKYDWFNGTYFVDDRCSQADEGTITFDITPYGNGTFVASMYVKKNPTDMLYTKEVVIGVKNSLAQLGNDIGLEGAVISFFMITGLVTAALVTGSATAVILIGIVGIAVFSILGFFKLTLLMFTTLMIIGGLIIFLMRR